MVRPTGLVSRATKSQDIDSWTNQVGPIGVFDGKPNYDVNWKDLDEGKTETFSNVPGWLGFTDKYWLTALAPEGAMTGEFQKGRERRLPGRLFACGCYPRTRPIPHVTGQILRRREGKAVAEPI